MDRWELDRPLAEVDRERRQLRRATLELREMGRRSPFDQEYGDRFRPVEVPHT